MKNKNRTAVRAYIADKIDVSKDIILDTVLVKLVGTHEVCVENYKGILEYSDKSIKIKTKPKNLLINGRGLELICMTDEILNVRGYIEQIEFED